MFSKSTEYALRATIYVARYSTFDKKLSIVEIAEGIGAPRSFTAKILQTLSNKKNGIIQSITGPNGGFYVSDSSLKRPLMHVIEVMGEKEVIEKCVIGLPDCSEDNPCSMYKSYKGIKLNLQQLFNEKTIEDLKNSKDMIMPVKGFIMKCFVALQGILQLLETSFFEHSLL